ncbi:hypothetical protein D9M71_844920 [compost metagenome]
MHEDRDDQPRLQQHQYEDHRPAEVTREVEVIHHVRQGAEDEQQPPYLQVQADRVLLTFGMCHLHHSPALTTDRRTRR